MCPLQRAISVLATGFLLLAACGGKTDGNGGGSGGSCVYINPSSYDQSCEQASDCMYVASGQICSGLCLSPDALINVSGQAAYQQALSSLTLPTCFGPNEPEPECINHQCTLPAQ